MTTTATGVFKPTTNAGLDEEPASPTRQGSEGRPVPSVAGSDETRAAAKAHPDVSRAAPTRIGALILAADVFGLLGPALTQSSGRLPLVAAAVLSVLLFQARGLYRWKLHLAVLDEMPALLPRSIASALVVGLAVERLGLRPGIGVYIALAGCGIVAQLVLRGVVYAFLRWDRTKRLTGQKTLVLGGGVVGSQIAATLRADRSYGLDVVGFLDSDPLVPAGHHEVPYLGSMDGLPAVLVDRDVRVLIVAFSRDAESGLVDTLRAVRSANCEVFMVPRFFEILGPSGQSDHIGAIPVVRLRRARARSLSTITKRAIDIAVSGMALVLLSPILLAAAAAVRLEGGPGVIFRQVRIGRDGVPFEVLKLRSLKPVDETDSGTTWNIKHDLRLGSVGKWLRKTSIDELPQLFNILRGEMSLVGPRPERPHFVEQFSAQHPTYAHRHRVRVGLTGLAQVNGLRGDTSISDRVRYDNYYIENWSLWLDMKIMIVTLHEVVAAKGG